MEHPVTAVYDANVLYPAPLRDLIVRLAQAGLVRDCLVTGYEELADSMALPDPDDRHVLAAAIRAGAEAIVTHNLTDFPGEILAGFDIEAQHPDDFFVSLLDLAPGAVCAAVKAQRDSLRNPPKTAEELLATLEAQGLTQAVASLRQFAALL
ncbi:MAG: PIN domain-containing protein [Pirellulaceae bacterium]|nr:PIN domain-containing protein [Pirellulaceae bacterium]